MTEEKWFVTAKRADFQGIADRFGISPVTARLIRNRDIVGDEAINAYLHGTTADLSDPRLMKDMEKAAALIEEKIREKRPMRIVGDYDIDGVCSSYILLKGFRQLGAVVDVQIPDRIKDGYGINESIIRKAAADGIDTIVTCDNGISAIPEIALAKDFGMTVIVTDHHDVPFADQPDGRRVFLQSAADAVVNPKQADCAYPFKVLCGAGVAYQLMHLLYAHAFGEAEGAARNEQEFLPFAAIATVGDVVDLQGENRILVKYGLRALAFADNPGLQALMQACGVDPAAVSAYHVGFVLGPCINAAGRLDTARRSLELFLTEDPEKAVQLAQELKELNDARKDMTLRGTEEAKALIARSDLKNDAVLVVPLYACHESLAGIIAGKIREAYHKPTFVLTRAEEGIKGSGRSIEQYSMYEELVKCRQYLDKFGGHPMAAGLSMQEAAVDDFRRALNANARLTAEDFIPKVAIDVAMPFEYVTEQQITELSYLEPFGKANEKPQFAQKDVEVCSARVLGKNRNVLRLSLQSPFSSLQVDAVSFADPAAFDAYVRQKFGDVEAEKMYLGRKNAVRLSVVYYPEIHTYRGEKNIQIVVKNYR